MKLEVDTFDLGTSEEKARKVCEESIEFYAEHALKSLGMPHENLFMEIGDVFTALANYCASNGIDAQYCIDLAQAKNILRGRYDCDNVETARPPSTSRTMLSGEPT